MLDEVGELSRAAQVRVDQAESAEAAGACAVSAQVRDEELVRVADDHMADAPAAVDHQAYLSVDEPAQLGQAPGELWAHKATGRHAPVVQGLKRLALAVLQAVCLAVDSPDGARTSGRPEV